MRILSITRKWFLIRGSRDGRSLIDNVIIGIKEIFIKSLVNTKIAVIIDSRIAVKDYFLCLERDGRGFEDPKGNQKT